MASGSKHYRPHARSGSPYNFFGDYLRRKFGCRVLKLPIHAGFSCPNRDGTLGSDGCVFCSDGSASPTSAVAEDILLQMHNARSSYRRADAGTRFIAYFQAFTNTHAPVEILKSLYTAAVQAKDVAGLMIGTRPDCVPDDVLNLIASYAREHFELWLEIGMQSMHDRSLKFLNRRHDYSATKDAFIRAASKGIQTCAHIIIGIPGESWQDMMDTAVEISRSPVNGVKIHQLHVIKDTPLEELHENGLCPALTLKEYVSIVCDFLERLRPDILIHRLLGDRNEKTLVAPAWGLHKGTVLNAIAAEFTRRGTRQGFLCV